MSETIIERITEKKVQKPAPFTDEMLGMIERFRGMTKEEMIAKFNSPNCGPSWTPHEQRVAKAAMLLILKGLAPAPIQKRTEMSDLDDEIEMYNQNRQPKSPIELALEKELPETKPLGTKPDLVILDDLEEEPKEEKVELPITPVEKKIEVTRVEKVDGRRKNKSLRDLIPEDKKK
ncbi:MAG: hypothetical protein WC455_19965 [Dehalococcoidia bacterium]|jgi:hypothetical protein